MNAALKVRIGADMSQARQAFRDMKAQTKQLQANLKGLGRSMSTYVTAPLAALGVVGVRSAMQLEVFQQSLNTLVGDAGKAREVFEDLYEFDTQTTFAWPSLTKATTLLAAFNVESEDLIPTLGRLGDIASAVNMDIDELAEIYGKAKVQGRLFMEDINQLTGRGIPIIQELAEQFGVTEDQVRSLVTEGRVGFANIERAFVNMTSEGGRFFGMMASQTDTSRGRLMALRKEFEQVTDLIGEMLLPHLDRLVGSARRATEWFVNLGEETQRLIVTAAGLAAAIGPVLLGLSALVAMAPAMAAAWVIMTGPIGTLTVAIGLVAAAVTALVVDTEGSLAELKRIWARTVHGIVEEALWLAEAIAKVNFLGFGHAAREAVGPLQELERKARASLDAITAGYEGATGAAREFVQMGTGQDIVDAIFGDGRKPKGGGGGGGAGDGKKLGEVMKDLRAELDVIDAKFRIGVGSAIDAARGRAEALRSAIQGALEATGGRVTQEIIALRDRLREAVAGVRILSSETASVRPPEAIGAIDESDLLPWHRIGTLARQAREEMLGLREIPAVLNDIREKALSMGEQIQLVLLQVGPAIARGLADNLAYATGQLLTLQTSFKSFGQAVVQSLRNVIAQIIAAIAKMLVLKGLLELAGGPSTLLGGIISGAMGRGVPGGASLSSPGAGALPSAGRGGGFGLSPAATITARTSMSGELLLDLIVSADDRRMARGRASMLGRG